MKMKSVLFASVAVALLCAPMVSAENSYTAKNWGEAINTLPCAAFTKNADGSWTIGNITLGRGGSAMTNGGFSVGSSDSQAMNWDTTDTTLANETLKGGKEVAILDQRCGQKAP